MKTDITDFLKRKFLGHALRNVPYLSPKTVFLALFLSPTDNQGGGKEVSGNGYARRAMEFGQTETDLVNANVRQVQFPIALNEGWGKITHAALFDSQMGGNMLMHGPLERDRFIGIEDILLFNAGEFVVDWSELLEVA